MASFYLDFVTSGYGKVYFKQEPEIRNLPFKANRAESRYALDVFSAGEDLSLRVTEFAEPDIFKILLHDFKIYNFNAVVKFGLEYSEEVIVMGDVYLGNSFKTDYQTYCEFKLTQNSESAKFKRRYELPVDLLSRKDIDNNDIEPVKLYKIFQKALPVTKTSSWITPDIPNGVLTVLGTIPGAPAQIVKYFGFANQTILSGIKNTLSYIQGVGDKNDFVYVEAAENYSNIKLEISNVNFALSGTGSGRTSLRLFYAVGTNDTITNNSGGIQLNNIYIDGDGSDEVNDANYVIDIPLLERGQKIYIWYEVYVQNYESLVTYTSIATAPIMNVRITGVETSYSGVIFGVRLIDAIKQAVKSTTGKNVIAPRWDEGGEFYNQFITNANLIRQLVERTTNGVTVKTQFNVTNKRLGEEYVKEPNADHYVLSNGDVFYGRYMDFFQPVECGEFKDAIDFTIGIKPSAEVNQAVTKFKNYASQKENTQENTIEIVHGSKTDFYQNENGKDTYETELDFIRDAFTIQNLLTTAYSTPETSTTNDDSKIILIDCLPVTVSVTETQTSFLQHTVNGNVLTLRNQSDFNFVLLGIEPNTQFFIYQESVNTGFYTVLEVYPTTLILNKTNTSVPPVANEGTRTRYRYIPQAEYKNRTDEGFSLIQGISAPDSFSNLAYTVGRIAKIYYSEVHAENTLFATSKDIRNTVYDNNPGLITRLSTEVEPVVEGGIYQGGTPIRTGNQIKVTVPTSIRYWLSVQDKLEEFRGFVKIAYNGQWHRGFISSGSFTAETSNDYEEDFYGRLDLTLDEMYFPQQLEIIYDGSVLMINGIIESNAYKSTVNQYGDLLIFDKSDMLLWPPTLFSQVTINGVAPASKEELIITIGTII